MKKLLLFLISLLISIGGVKAFDLDLHGTNALIYNYDNDNILYEKAADEVISIGSLTKITTAIVLMENIDDLDKTIILESKHFKGLVEQGASLAGFYLGEKVTYRDLLYGILLPSGAEAVQTLAIEVFGSNDNLVAKMNEKANELKLVNTHYVNPFGLDADKHYSTLKDVSIVLKYALKNELFKELYTTRRYLTSDKNLTLYSTLVDPLNNINKKAEFIKGSKTGFTYNAGRCMSSLLYDEENDIYYLMFTAGSDNVRTYPVLDTINAYNKLTDTYAKKKLYRKDDVVTTIRTKFAKEKKVDIKTDRDISIFYEKSNFDENKITYKYKVPDKTTKILEKDSKVGTVYIYYDNEKIEEAELLLVNDMEFSLIRFIINIVLPLTFLAVVTVFTLKLLKNKQKVV